MNTGYLKLKVFAGDEVLPLENASFEISDPSGRVLFSGVTDESGLSKVFALPTPDKKYTLDVNYNKPAYATYNVVVEKPGFVTQHISGVGIVDTQTAILPVEMQPLSDENTKTTDDYKNIEPLGLLQPVKYNKADPPPVITPSQQPIPEYITVHLGVPSDTTARNVRVKFSDYIKNVVSSEIYSTWPTNSLYSNIHAVVTFALNRIYTEWYRSRGYNFDITNSTSYDMAYREGGQIYESISKIVDEIFNVFAHRQAFSNPFFTQFCNGSTVTCPGLSQWGTVTLANQGLTPLEILRYYYPRDIVLTTSNNIVGIAESFPGTAMRLGDSSADIRTMQNYLNRIRVNYPLIPQITNLNGIFDLQTQDAVRTFQRIFNLTADGIIGRATWNKITQLFVGVTRLAELDSEGTRFTIGTNPPNVVLRQETRGGDVLQLQFILNTIAAYYNSVPPTIMDGVFGADTRNSVIEFQKTFNLTPDGIVGPSTWAKLYSVYRGIDQNITVPQPPTPPVSPSVPWPGVYLKEGTRGESVKLMQTYLNTIRLVYSNIPHLSIDGIFGPLTRTAVVTFQQIFGLVPDGIIGPVTWAEIVKQRNALV